MSDLATIDAIRRLIGTRVEMANAPRVTDEERELLAAGLALLQAVDRLTPKELCRMCGNPAEMIVWGKLFPPEALGPRCYHCASEQIGVDAASGGIGVRMQYAVYRFPKAMP